MIQSWQDTWLDVALVVAKRSKCSRAQVGAVIVDSKQRVIATGYNGPAATYETTGTCINWCERAKTGVLDKTYDTCPSIHAEANALLYVDRSAVEGGTLYVTTAPCFACAKLISNSGIKHVVWLRSNDAHRQPEEVINYFKQCKIGFWYEGINQRSC